MEEKRKEVIDYIRIFWRRRWFVFVGTAVCVIVTLIVSLLVKPVYEVDAIIQPGKLFIEDDETGEIVEFVVEKPQQIADTVKHRTYESLIISALNLKNSEMPRIGSIHISRTLLVKIWLRISDVELGKTILNMLIQHLKKDMDSKIDVEKGILDHSIEESKIEKERREKNLEILKNKIGMIQQRQKDILKEMQVIKAKIDELEKERAVILERRQEDEAGSLSLWLYSNAIAQNYDYYEGLSEKLSLERERGGDMNTSLQEEHAEISKLGNAMANLEQRKKRIDYTKVLKEPTPSFQPAHPKIKLNVALSFVLGLFFSLLLVFFLEYLEDQKRKE